MTITEAITTERMLWNRYGILPTELLTVVNTLHPHHRPRQVEAIMDDARPDATITDINRAYDLMCWYRGEI